MKHTITFVQIVSFNLSWLLNGRNLNDLPAKPAAEAASTK